MKKNIIIKYLFLLVCLYLPLFVQASSSNNYQILNDGFGTDLSSDVAGSENYSTTNSNANIIGNASIGISGLNTSPDDTSNTPSPNPTTSPQLTTDDLSTTSTSPSIVTDQINKVIEVINNSVEAIVTNPTVEKSNSPAALTAALLTGLVSAAPLAANLPLSSYSLTNLFYTIFPFIGRRRKTRNWGSVYDSQTNQPVSRAVVRICDQETKKILQTLITDNVGRFNLMITKGNYFIEIFKENYQFPSKISTIDYHGGNFSVGEEGLKDLNIPIDPHLDKLVPKIQFVWNFKKILEFLYYPLMFFGTIIAILFFIKYKDLNNSLVLTLYFLILIYEMYKKHKSRPFGLVFEFNNKKPLEMAIVRIFDEEKNKLISTVVTNIGGKFVFLVNQGNYFITGIKQGYKQYRSNSLKFSTSNLINIDVPLEKQQAD